MSNLTQIVETLSALTVMEAAELSKMLEEKWGVSAAAPVAMAAPVAAAAAVEEKTDFEVILVAAGATKIKVIQKVRVIFPALGLVEAKDLVDKAPHSLKAGIPKAEADSIKAQLEEVGATVEIK